MKNKKAQKYHPLYRRWTHIRACYTNPKYKDYHYTKALGLTCDWTDFWDFAEDIEIYLGLPPSRKHKLNRIDPNVGWQLKNLRWALPKQVGRNQRHTFKIRYKNRTQSIPDWCEELGLKYWTVRRRYIKGLKPKDCLRAD